MTPRSTRGADEHDHAHGNPQMMRFTSREERDAALQSGIAEGTAIYYDRLAEILGGAA